MVTATFVRRIPRNRPDIDARLYRLSEEIMYDDNFTNFVIVSAADVPLEALMMDAVFGSSLSSCETYIFASNESGDILDYEELDGSYKGGKDHVEAIRRAGWELTE